MKLLKLIVIGILITCASITVAQTNNNSFNIETMLKEPIDKLAQSFLKDSLMKSLSVGVFYKGETFIQHYGELDTGKNNKPSNRTIYDIGSVTKTFVGTLMAKAELDKKLSIEDDIRDYLEGDYSNLQYQGEPIKIRHLITHTGGLPRFLPLRIADEFDHLGADLADRISKITNSYSKTLFLEDLKQITIDTLPGVRYSYSNAGAELAAYVLEIAYGIPFEILLKQNIFDAANMNSSYINLPKTKQKEYANGYGDFNNITPAMEPKLWGGSGYGKSTVQDLMNYIKYQLSDKVEVHKSHEILFDQENTQRGYMWVIREDGDFGLYVNHHGGAFGVQNWMMIYPEEKMGISVITNQSGRQTAGKLYNVLDGILVEIANDKYATDLSEEEQIRATLIDYIEGSTNGQPERLKKAFHPDLNLYYNWDREFRIWSGKDYILDTKEGEPTGETGTILSIDYENDLATAKIRISNADVEIPYIDYLMLIKINGHWTIIHKMFTKEVKK